MRRAFLMVVVGVYAALPLLLLYTPARVSSDVLDLLIQINQLRVRSEFSDKYSMRRMDRASHLCKRSSCLPAFSKSDHKESAAQTTIWSRPTAARDRASPWATRLSI